MTKLQERITELARKGRSVRQIKSVTTASETYIRRLMEGAKAVRVQAPRQSRQYKAKAPSMPAFGSIKTLPAPGYYVKAATNGHLSAQAIEARAVEYLEKAAELRRAAAVLRGAGFIS